MADPSEEQTKELFARFGLAYYQSECVHRALCNAFTIAPFPTAQGVSGPRIDERMNEAFDMTLGQLVEAIDPWTPRQLREVLDEVVERRNYLAHHFWFERCHMAHSVAGADTLLGDLMRDLELFDRADREVKAHFEPHSEALGITTVAVTAAFEDMCVQPEEWQHPQTQRRLRKSETIVRIWDVPIAEGESALIFELEDGSLWQLSDVGLGWTRFRTTSSSWAESALLKPYLPARINPRPADPGSWQYEVPLAYGAVLSVSLSRSRAHTYEWKLRTKSDASKA